MPANINGGPVLSHVQAFADALKEATGVASYGTYEGHQPSRRQAIDIFHRIGDHGTADRICDFYVKNWKRFGGDYIISRRRIWNPEVAGYWRQMEDRGSPTQNHDDHAHISFEGSAPGPFDGGGGTVPQPPKEDQMYSVSPPDTGYLVNLGQRKVLDIGGAVQNAAPVGVWAGDGQPDQRWQVWHHGAPPGGRHEVSFVSRAGKALDSPHGNRVWAWDFIGDQANQRWVIVSDSAFGNLWVIEHPHREGRVLTVGSDGYSVELEKLHNGDANQRWLFAQTI